MHFNQPPGATIAPRATRAGDEPSPQLSPA